MARKAGKEKEQYSSWDKRYVFRKAPALPLLTLTNAYVREPNFLNQSHIISLGSSHTTTGVRRRFNVVTPLYELRPLPFNGK